MDIKKYIKYTTEDFIPDDNFVNSILHSTGEEKQCWEEFLKEFHE